MSENPQDPIDRMVAAYEAMLERVHETADSAEKKTMPWLREALAGARDKAVELEELTREEADRISRYVERDLQEAAGYLANSGQELRDWLSFDWQLMQDRMLDMFAGMADQTSQALKEIADQAREASFYHSGEVAAPGVLQCTRCGETLSFDKTARIPDCPKCGANRFQRKSADAR